ncbi:MAG TPA: hypothetical protein PLN06_03940 [Bacteroidales bacterium]|nr:hypothetical protein [Bacteroidales bacterium]HQG52855.1 hypothetical protein [Bacteroidales bacterium]HQJ20174.1 hypothetical protein [Bacteroidales bacterium]
MKKFAVTMLIAFVIIMVASSCNKQVCPAYSKADVSKTEHKG